jgi:histidinol-phosphatase (PHP family)
MDEMLAMAPPTIVGHFDLVKKNNRAGVLFSEDSPWYRDRVLRSVDALRRSGAVMEINTGGLARNTSGALYPSEWILEECIRVGIPMVVDSDAHQPEGVSALFEETAHLLDRLGATTVKVLTRSGFEPI